MTTPCIITVPTPITACLEILATGEMTDSKINPSLTNFSFIPTLKLGDFICPIPKTRLLVNPSKYAKSFSEPITSYPRSFLPTSS